MNKKILLLFVIFLSSASALLSQALTGDKIIKATGGDYPTLEAALTALNTNGASGTVRFLIDEDLNEIGANLVINRNDLNATNNLVIKPNAGKNPIIRINNCAPSTVTGTQADTARRQAGLTLLNTSFVTIDGSNTTGGSTRDLTFLMGDVVNGIQVINLFGNSDNVVIKNTKVLYDSINSSSTSTRAIYANGQWTGVADDALVENCQIGNGLIDPYYAISITGASGISTNASKTKVKNNLLYGRVRPLYFFRGGVAGTTIEVSGNTIENVIAPAVGNVVWGVLLNTYDGEFKFFNNKIINLTSVNNTTSGIYAFGTLSGALTSQLNIYNNFFGGNIQHTGTGTPASIDVISLQDNARANIYFNTIVLNEFTNRPSSRTTCIRMGGTSIVNISNNLIVSYKNNANVYNLRYDGGTLVSNNNTFYALGDSANVGYHTAAARKTLADWVAISSQDSQSTYKMVNFTAPNDFHLTGASIGDNDLKGVPVAGITTDIDGDTRSATSPYKGADEVFVPGLQGIYYVGVAGSGPGGSNPHFPSFRAALDTISSNPIAGDCIFYITSDITEPYTDVRGIGLAVNPGPYTITFKPYTGVQPTITFNYPTDLNSGPSGAFIIGIPGQGNVTWDSLRTTRNIIIDGSNTPGGTTRDLTLQSAPTSQRNAMPLVIVGDVSDVVVKNTNIYYKTQTVSTSGNLFIGAIMVRHRNYLGVDWVPHDITFENNHISSNFDGVAQNAQGYGVYQTGTPLPLMYPYDITLKNNLIEGKRRAVVLYRAGGHDIIGNEIVLNQNIAANTTNEAVYAVDVDTNSVVNIYNNKISKVSSMTNAANMGNSAISVETFGTYNIYNNFIYGFALTASNPIAYVRGIRVGNANATVNASFNSIYMTDILAGGTVAYNGIYFTDGTADFKNNIVFNAVVDFAAYCVNRTGALGTFTSNYNDFHYVDATNGNVGFWNTAAAQTLAAWQTASSQDANSISANPLFVSATDLHLSVNTSPAVGKGVAVAGITLDIDGNLRDNIPEMGAHEFPGFIPVELVSFKAVTSGSSVTLNWETKTETNNSYFEVEKRTENTSFESVARLTGAGTSTQPVKYSYTDINAGTGTVYYRLRQVDFDGTVTYSSEVSADLSIPTEFSLSQNYPNPFNPTTTIKFGIPADSRVLLELYTVTGEKVATLIDGDLSAGYHQHVLNASHLSTGVYLYRLSAGEFSSVKKLMLVK